MYRRGSSEISSHVHSFQDEEEATNDAVFFLKQRSHEEKQMTVILGLELTKIMFCSSSESANKTIQTTVSMARIKQSNQQYPWL